ncbi:DNA-binding response regulator [Candidatus Acetothermia bacterium]|nr:MAG: DNA-binding response regulator [Candidatus Acetothermia bacterium]
MMNRIRVVLGDDHALVREGIRALLVSSGIEVAGEAGDGRALVRLVRKVHPDVALVDVAMPILNGIEAIRRMRRVSPDTRVIVLSMYADEGYISQAARAGASGYVLKDEAPERLVAAIAAVAAGGIHFSSGVPEPEDEGLSLTEREREVLQLIVEGKRNAEIAQIMSRSLHTVRNHRARLMRKLGAHTAAELVEAADRLGIARLAPKS